VHIRLTAKRNRAQQVPTNQVNTLKGSRSRMLELQTSPEGSETPQRFSCAYHLYVGQENFSESWLQTNNDKVRSLLTAYKLILKPNMRVTNDKAQLLVAENTNQSATVPNLQDINVTHAAKSQSALSCANTTFATSTSTDVTAAVAAAVAVAAAAAAAASNAVSVNSTSHKSTLATTTQQPNTQVESQLLPSTRHKGKRVAHASDNNDENGSDTNNTKRQKLKRAVASAHAADKDSELDKSGTTEGRGSSRGTRMQTQGK